MADLLFRALSEVWRALEPLSLRMAVMGGIAVSAWKSLRATRDVDLLIALQPDQLVEALRVLDQAGFRAKVDPPVLQLGSTRIVQLLYEPPEALLAVQVDLLLADTDYHRQALERRVMMPIPAISQDIAVLTCEDLILHKLLAGRILDRADCVTLLTLNRATFDIGYTRDWAGKLGLDLELEAVWRDAFPGESLPPR